MQLWLSEHPVVAYIVIFVLVAFVYNKVFRPQNKVPLWKEVILYILLALGSLILLVFQIDKLPIIQCLLVAIGLMMMVRIRYFIEARNKRKNNSSTGN